MRLGQGSGERRHTFRHSAKGFSLVEALFAIILTLIGLSAVFSMQGATMQANLSARDLSAAANLGERVISQLHKESFMWTANSLPAPHLNQTPDQWHSFHQVPVDHNLQPHRLDDADQGTPLLRQRFCVHYWIEPLSGLYYGLLNARVRVIWPRNPMNTTLIEDACGEANANAYVDEPGKWFSITIPAVLRRHPL